MDGGKCCPSPPTPLHFCFTHITFLPMANSKPTLLLIHGCFTTPAAFDRLVPFLEHTGYTTIRATYPSTDPEESHESTAAKDVEHMRNVYLLPLVEQEQKDVVMVMHSWGGTVGAGAAVGLSKTDRVAQGLGGGVVGFSKCNADQCISKLRPDI